MKNVVGPSEDAARTAVLQYNEDVCQCALFVERAEEKERPCIKATVFCTSAKVAATITRILPTWKPKVDGLYLFTKIFPVDDGQIIDGRIEDVTAGVKIALEDAVVPV